MMFGHGLGEGGRWGGEAPRWFIAQFLLFSRTPTRQYPPPTLPHTTPRIYTFWNVRVVSTSGMVSGLQLLHARMNISGDGVGGIGGW